MNIHVFVGTRGLPNKLGMSVRLGKGGSDHSPVTYKRNRTSLGMVVANSQL